VPWGRGACLTSEIMTPYSESLVRCYEDLSGEGGEFIRTCDVQKISVSYTEENDQYLGVPFSGLSTYDHALLYDGEPMYITVSSRNFTLQGVGGLGPGGWALTAARRCLQRASSRLEPGATREVDLSVTYETAAQQAALTWLPRPPPLWGAITEGQHTLELILDYGGTNTSAGSVTLSYCAMAELDICSCGWALSAGEGVTVNASTWEWTSGGYCVGPDALTADGDVLGLQVRPYVAPMSPHHPWCHCARSPLELISPRS
jgi:hypothetical protein